VKNSQTSRCLIPVVLLLWATAPAAAVPVTESTSTARQYVQAEQAFRAGDYSQAEQLYSKIIEAHGDEPTAWFRIGLMRQRRQSFRAALNAYDSALSCAPAESSEEITQVLAKVRFNRALLLLESAARDLKSIAPGALDQNLDVARETLTAHVDAALRAADSEVTVEPPKSAAGNSASGYVYEAKTAVVTVGPIKERHP
jgi:tetratricopeptide (TPR) repeat protein